MDMALWIEVPETWERGEDYGRYTSYPGPAYVYGTGHCVDWGGGISNVHVQVYNSNCGARKEHRVTGVR
ncbi:hypothetical protein GCM10010302_75070 [Streptomyces polychromogenes]|uniref:Uncharacterized protein n=1 Tax=Streptomyces polychromogenes TaxID=67342 RepID=A0ABN0W4I1_9ACTN